MDAIQQTVEQKMLSHVDYVPPIFYLHFPGAKHIFDSSGEFEEYHQRILDKFDSTYIIDLLVDIRVSVSGTPLNKEAEKLSANWISENMIQMLDPNNGKFQR